MKASELRIGNWYLGYDDKYHTWVLQDFEDLNCGIEVEELIRSAIPLTPVILEKCGFERYNDELVIKLGHRYFLGFFSDLLCYTENTNTEDDSKVWHEHIKELHQLQNLYHALTGQELQITL